jgi:hypothetical protein
MSEVFVFAFTAAFNPTLLAASTVMLLMPSPKRLLLGYLLGATMTSITLGLLIVFSFEGSSTVSTAENSLSGSQDIVLGLLLLVIAYVIGTERQKGFVERRHAKRAEKPKKEPAWKKILSKGSARWTFVAGALLTLPGGSYLAGLAQMSKQGLGATETVLYVLAFNVIMLALLELPLLGYVFAPDWTPGAVQRFKEALSRNGDRILFIGALVLGILLIVRGLIELLT